MKQTLEDRAKKIKLIILDVDGVMTDGSFMIGDDGQQYKAFYTKDGQGISMLQRSGVATAIITGRTSEVVAHRAKELNITHVYQGQKNKREAFDELLKKLNLQAEQVAYVGDDVIDLPVMRHVGLACAVRDAEPLVKQYAHLVTPRDGGKGAVRDVCELIMRAQDTLEAALAPYITD